MPTANVGRRLPVERRIMGGSEQGRSDDSSPLGATTTRWPRLRLVLLRLPKWILTLLAIATAAFVFFVAIKTYEFLRMFDDALGVLANQSGMNRWLARALSAVFFVPVAWAAKQSALGLWRGGLRPKLVAGAYTAAYCVGMFLVTRNASFSHNGGQALKWYADTPEGPRFFDSPGFDPKYGVKLAPVTPALAAALERRKRGLIPKPVSLHQLDSLQLFDPLTGEARYWFSRVDNGRFELFDGPGFHPQTQQPLLPLTPEMVPQIAARVAAERREAADSADLAYLDRYVNRSVSKVPGRKQWALSLAGIEEGDRSLLYSAIRDAATTKGGGVVTLFRPRFMSDSLDGELFQGSPALAHRLNLDRFCDAVIMGRVHRVSSREGAMQGLVTTRTSMVVRLVSASSGGIRAEFRIDAKGGGFSPEAAQSQAAERISGMLRDSLQQVLP